MTFELLRDAIAKDLNQLSRNGRVKSADRLAAKTKQHFNATALPQYFFGDLNAPMVLVHLNPKQSLTELVVDRYSGDVPTLDQYFDYFAHFGREQYGPNSLRTHRSPFDHKQILFLRHFDLIDFLPASDLNAKWTNLERAIDNKLQLELVPYPSLKFSRQGMTPKVLEPHYQRLLGTITAKPRASIIFCGGALSKLIEPYVVREHRFRLPKVAGGQASADAKFSNLRIPFKGELIGAGFAPTFTKQGLNMNAYGEECAKRYFA